MIIISFGYALLEFGKLFAQFIYSRLLGFLFSCEHLSQKFVELGFHIRRITVIVCSSDPFRQLVRVAANFPRLDVGVQPT